ncbi:RluA family pseudouridine synthase [bacterium]|nr:RluA family pseudouridine synthase [candidate division CSSED10-310 bacterium]
MDPITIKAPPECEGQRIDCMDTSVFAALSRSRIQSLLRTGDIFVNGRSVKPSYRIRPGDLITVHIPAPEPLDIVPEAIPLDVLFEDQDIIVVNKPRSMVIHPGAGVRNGTLVHALVHHCADLSGIGGRLRPGIVHRLDKGTSGIVVVAKNDASHTRLASQFAQRQLHKEYLALVAGQPDWATITVDAPVGRHPVHRVKMAVVSNGRSARTTFRLLAASSQAGLVNAVLHTGRTHQIRVHLEYLRLPILGDTLYGFCTMHRLPGPAIHALKEITGVCLHAFRIELTHPTRRETVQFEAPIPDDFRQIMEGLDLIPAVGVSEQEYTMR